jgi:hypothetical protein
MALTIGQIAAASYPAVLNEMRATDQWSESAVLREMQRQGMIKRKSLGTTIDVTLDYRRNPNGGFLASDLATTSLTKTEVLTAASYAVAELSVPVVWSKGDDAKNPTENQKVAFVKNLLENGINTHDDLIEEALFASSATEGFLPFVSLMPTTGQGSPGGIDASTETFWRNYAAQYQADGSDIEAAFTAAHNDVAKGSGSNLTPTLLVGGADPHALYEASLVTRQRFVDVKEIDGGVKVLAFKTARFVFGQYGGENVFGMNKKSVQLIVSKEYFRDKGDQYEIQNANGFAFKIYSALQLVTDNKSRLFVLDEA